MSTLAMHQLNTPTCLFTHNITELAAWKLIGFITTQRTAIRVVKKSCQASKSISAKCKHWGGIFRLAM